MGGRRPFLTLSYRYFITGTEQNSINEARGNTMGFQQQTLTKGPPMIDIHCLNILVLPT